MLFFARAVSVEKRAGSEVERRKWRRLRGDNAEKEESKQVTRLKRKKANRWQG